MSASDTFTQRSQALALLRRRGLARLTEFREAGITAVTVSRMEQAGDVVRLARGLYQITSGFFSAAANRRWTWSTLVFDAPAGSAMPNHGLAS